MSKDTHKLRRQTPASAPAARTEVSELLTYQMWQESFSDSRKRRAIIQQIGDRIGRDFQPEKIILFGSQAYGIPTWYSDIDLLVVMPQLEDPLEQSVTMLKKLNIPISVDLLTRTSKQLQQRVEMGDRFIKEILERGQVIYETNYAGVD